MNKSLTEIEEKTRQSDQQVAAAALATHAAASTSKTKDFMPQRRLYVPGLLCHILRQPLPPGSNASESGSRKFTHIVMKGVNPKARFGRIVLSNTMLSDHSCPAYIDAVVDSLQCLAKGLNDQNSLQLRAN